MVHEALRRGHARRGGGDDAPLLSEVWGQAVVEAAVVLPVLLVVALIVWNVMTFAAAAARFDRVAPDMVIAHGVSPAGDGSLSAAAAVRDEIAAAMEPYDVEVEVVREGGGEAAASMLSLVAAPVTYTCRMTFTPWPSGLSVAGVALGAPPALEHERAVTVDPWRSGVVV